MPAALNSNMRDCANYTTAPSHHLHYATLALSYTAFYLGLIDKMVLACLAAVAYAILSFE